MGTQKDTNRSPPLNPPPTSEKPRLEFYHRFHKWVNEFPEECRLRRSTEKPTYIAGGGQPITSGDPPSSQPDETSKNPSSAQLSNHFCRLATERHPPGPL